MIQDISPYKFDNTYLKDTFVTNEDYILIFDNNEVFMLEENTGLVVPKYKDLKDRYNISNEDLTYLFKINDFKFFLLKNIKCLNDDYLKKENVAIFRTLEPEYMRLAGVTGKHISSWYFLNKYCGKCGHTLKDYGKERALICDDCSNIIYPTISPAIIVGIIDDDKILLTKYSRGNYKRYALVAGFVEVGESVEDTVRREVMEEVGLKVKNIRYYNSQPWGFSNSLLVGFFADLDGDNSVTLDKEELAEGTWYKYDELPEDDSLISLTHTMIHEFKTKKGKV